MMLKEFITHKLLEEEKENLEIKDITPEKVLWSFMVVKTPKLEEDSETFLVSMFVTSLDLTCCNWPPVDN